MNLKNNDAKINNINFISRSSLPSMEELPNGLYLRFGIQLINVKDGKSEELAACSRYITPEKKVIIDDSFENELINVCVDNFTLDIFDNVIDYDPTTPILIVSKGDSQNE